MFRIPMCEWKSKEKIKQEKLEKLYKKVDEYFRKVFHENFIPNMNMFKEAYYCSTDEFKENFTTFFAGYNKVDFYLELMEKLYNDKNALAKPMALMDYIHFFKDKKLNYHVRNLESYDMIKLDGTKFNVPYNSVLSICNNIVYWSDDSTELMQKITPIYSYEDKSITWGWVSITTTDIEKHYIDFKTEEENILQGK